MRKYRKAEASQGGKTRRKNCNTQLESIPRRKERPGGKYRKTERSHGGGGKHRKVDDHHKTKTIARGWKCIAKRKNHHKGKYCKVETCKKTEIIARWKDHHKTESNARWKDHHTAEMITRWKKNTRLLITTRRVSQGGKHCNAERSQYGLCRKAGCHHAERMARSMYYKTERIARRKALQGGYPEAERSPLGGKRK